ncbi:MAG: cation diffusion facilitator family transporter [Planctomycetota bacterium]|nr:cation diffusion facilitator family transporter [Planctomycetota bacterium]
MPDPAAHPQAPAIRRVAFNALIAGFAIMGLKYAVYYFTDSTAVLSDALESIINIAAALMMLFALWLAHQPADSDHPYGHGKIEFLAIGFEGAMILAAGIAILYAAAWRFLHPIDIRADLGVYGLACVGLLSALLAGYVFHAGHKYQSPTLLADGRHLLTDVVSTVGVFIGLVLVHVTGRQWLDPLVALLMGAIVVFTSTRLLFQSINGLMDREDPQDSIAIKRILDEEVAAGAIRGYHKVRHRHSGAFHWVDLHLQIDGDIPIREGHEIASRIEGRIERLLGQADATAHLEPHEPDRPAPHSPQPPQP